MTHHRSPRDSVVETIGETPLVRIGTDPADVEVYAKLETFNPGGSVKDRIGAYILEELLERGEVPPGGTIVEPTAGNTGIGMAIAAGHLGLDAIFVVPRGFSEEKTQLMAALGADIRHSPHEEGMTGAIEAAEAIVADRDDAVVPQQFANPLNVQTHAETTAPEIFDALDGDVGAIVAGIGSGGTLMGLAKYAAERDETPRIVGVEPAGSTYGTILNEDPGEGPYKIEGIGTHEPDLAKLLDPEFIDEIRPVADRDAHDEVARLAAEEGHLVGSSSGAASVAAQAVAREIATGEIDAPAETVVTVFPDSSERYLSKGIYGSFDDWEGKA
jgi:O-acetylserine dependent cystathionine beta-synthase